MSRNELRKKISELLTKNADGCEICKELGLYDWCDSVVYQKVFKEKGLKTCTEKVEEYLRICL